jgi:hypothetical protein
MDFGTTSQTRINRVFAVCIALSFALPASGTVQAVALPQRILLGPYSLEAPRSNDWVRSEALEVNHQTMLTNSKAGAAITTRFDALTSYELGVGNDHEVLTYLHREWMQSLEMNQEDLVVINNVATASGPSVLQAVLRVRAGERESQVLRSYRLVRSREMVLVATVETRGDVPASVRADFNSLANSISVEPKEMLSPCVRAGFIKQRLLRFVSLRRALGKAEAIGPYIESLKGDLESLGKEHANHSRGVRHLCQLVERFEATR